MKKTIFSLIVIFLLTAVLPESKAETVSNTASSGVIHLLLGKSGSSSASKRLKKRKLKKVVRKAGRVYRNVKTDRTSKKKSRKVQRNARRIINIF